MIRRLLAGATSAALATLAVGVFAFPASAAAKPNPCKVLKNSEIASALGGATVGAGAKGFSSAVSDSCDYPVTVPGGQPQTFTVHVMTTGAQVAYDGLKAPAFGYVPIAGLAKSLWSAKTSTVDVLQGKVLVGVQGQFPQDQLVALAKIARKRV